MSFLRRPALLALLLIGAGLAARLPAGHAQSPVPARFAFADTTLLRDTLDLKFDRLFSLADSLRVLPDSLRALSIRYRLALDRIVWLADSLRMPVDSVGPVMDRERFNPLAAGGAPSNTFSYNSGFSIGRRSTTWSNDADYGYVAGPIFIRNVTNVSITRTRDGDLTDMHKTRSSNTEIGWRFSPDLSVGTRVSLKGTENFKPNSIYNNSTSDNTYDFSARSRLRPSPDLNAELSLNSGPFDEPRGNETKRGFGGVLTGRLNFKRGTWLTHDLNGTATGRFGRARFLQRGWQDTRDLTSGIKGNLSLFDTAPLSLRVGFSVDESRVERPDVETRDGGTDSVDVIVPTPTSNRSLDVSVRFQKGADHYLNVTERLTSTHVLVSSSRDGRFTREPSLSDDQSFAADGRTTLRGWTLDARFSNGFPGTDQTTRIDNPQGGVAYGRERTERHSRSVSATVSKNLTTQLALNAGAGVDLTSRTRTVVGESGDRLDESRDDYYRQNYRIEALYTRSQRVTTGIKLEVVRILSLQLLAAESRSNTEQRSYLAEWRWNYRLLRGLTATQRNKLSANYTFRPFEPEKNNVRLEYNTVTALNAIVTPRLNIDVEHTARLEPRGAYTRAPDALEYFYPSDETREYKLVGSISYAPSQAMRLSLQPSYRALDWDGTLTSDGEVVPRQRDRELYLTGGANVNLQVGGKGRLSGNIARRVLFRRETKYPDRVTRPDPILEWNGSLQFSWQL